jgi:uncharacterized protein involved in exopolysaccharide biosynthesis
MTGPREPLSLDLGTALGLLIRRWRRVVAGTLLGLICGGLVVLLWPPSYTATALLLIRAFPDEGGLKMPSGLSQLRQLVPNLMGSNQGDEELATELALLQSRTALGVVVDSLRLEVQPRNPRRIPPAQLVDSLSLPHRFKPVKLTLAAGTNALPQGSIYVSQTGGGARVKLVDREDAISDLADRVGVDNAGGDVVKLTYRGRDSITAAQVPNLLAQVYMLRRTTVDRGLNHRRLDFLVARADTIRRQLSAGVDALARLQEQSGTGVDATITAKGLADQYAKVEGDLAQVRASRQALDSLVRLVAAGDVNPRSLAGFPELLSSVAINELVTSMATLETERTVLLSTASATAPRVIALGRARDSLAAQLMPLTQTFHKSLERQEASLQADADSLKLQLNRLPGRAAEAAKQTAEVKQLAQLDAGMGAQVLQARLAAMAEGGDVRLVDAAAVPRRVTFPRPAPTLLAGLLGGMILGLLLVPVGARDT